jgi:hypothetical protein
MTTVLQDLRYAARRLRQSPGFAIVCVITLALGIGANTAIFTLVDAVMVKSLPVANPGELYRLGDNYTCCVNGGFQEDWSLYSYPLYLQLRDYTPEFSQLAGFQAATTDLRVRSSGADTAEPYVGEFVSGNYFSTFGLGAFAGRVITPDDDRPGAAPVAVMSYRAWQQHYGGDPSVVGATFTINMVPYTVAGIAPSGFFGDQVRANPPDFWLPLATEPALTGAGSILHHPEDHWLYTIGRLKPGAKPASIQAEVTVELQQWLSAQPDLLPRERSDLGKQHIVVIPGGAGKPDNLEPAVRYTLADIDPNLTVLNMQSFAEQLSLNFNQDTLITRLTELFGLLALILACVGLYGVTAYSVAQRTGEIGIRMALGANRGNVLGLVLRGAFLQLAFGLGVGIPAALAGGRLLSSQLYGVKSHDPVILGAAVLVLGACALLAGFVAARRAASIDPMQALRSE